MAPRRGDLAQRRRTERAEARRRILAAAARQLEERAWQEVALDEVMAAADLSRTVFYRHFEDRRALLLALLDESGVGADPAGAIWKQGTGDPLTDMRRGLDALTDLFVEHGRLLQAVADLASHDPEVRELWARLAEGFVATTTERMAAETAAGRSAVADPQEVARALVWMNERYLLACFGRRPFVVERDAAAAALAEIWAAVVYGHRQPAK
jgi:AcrR family transcriptional regulator